MKSAAKLFGAMLLGFGTLTGCAPTSGGVGPVGDVANNVASEVVEQTRASECAGQAAPLAAFCKGLDLARIATIPKSAVSSIDYSETDRFDRQLHASMKGRVPDIRISFGDARPSYADLTQVPAKPPYDATQLVFWQAQVLNSGGNIGICETAPYESILSALGSIIIEVLFGIADDWLTYRQANNYHSILVVTRQNAEGDPDYLVDSVEFSLRSNHASGLQCPTGTVEYAILERK